MQFFAVFDLDWFADLFLDWFGYDHPTYDISNKTLNNSVHLTIIYTLTTKRRPTP
jgi:hypothetical protein